MTAITSARAKVSTIRGESPVTILMALVAVVAIGAALLVVALFGQEHGGDSTPIVLYVTGTITTVVVALLALFKAEQGATAAKGAKDAVEALPGPPVTDSEDPPTDSTATVPL